ncbi:methylenetetrahydrofolate reductase [Acidocella sp.]|uniref:methylenetetrahydrofolate reductase n=1 Tax=Acidocella sp. TaxID=50710 RepID=UPI00260AF446|nr:methylenetetrahydrofolate reductase [Acidocella sp.]
MSELTTSTRRWSCLDRFSLEATARDMPALAQAAPELAPGTVVAIPFLPGETDTARLEATSRVRALGFTPMPHLAARHLPSRAALLHLLEGWRAGAGVERLLVLAGDRADPRGPYQDALSLIETGLLAAHGIRQVVISGYPEGHPRLSDACLTRAMRDKLTTLAAQGLAAEIATQFGFSAPPVLAWLAALRMAGVEVPVRLGLPGPANMRTLLRFAALCGVSASASVLARYGFSLNRLRSHAGPQWLVRQLADELTPERHGEVLAHFYPFGGIANLTGWLAHQRFIEFPLAKTHVS